MSEPLNQLLLTAELLAVLIHGTGFLRNASKAFGQPERMQADGFHFASKLSETVVKASDSSAVEGFMH